ncbi:DNA-binding protein [Lonsdalea britannica]|uniref:DNA-binding protein n=1 Tax=Lonsdalea britannica TaxID=1082704 RepID=UPI000A1E6E76|nr:DNA-binding protein [Lonsdalea britannica]OSN08580.1 DNA-binding protein [Lonsdalea britannica]
MDNRTPSFSCDSSARWRDHVTPGGSLSPAERRAFEKAIHLVSTRIDQVLSHKDKPRAGVFDFDAFVDSLEADFLGTAGDRLTSGLNSDVGQTAFWIIRVIADHLIALQAQRYTD